MPRIGTQLLRFALTGVAGLLVDIAVLYGALWLGLGWYGGRVLSFLAAVCATWLLNRRYTFHAAAGGSLWREWWRYLLAMSGGGVVNYAAYSAMLALAAPVVDVRWLPVLAVGTGSLAGMTVNFVAAKWFVFQR